MIPIVIKRHEQNGKIETEQRLDIPCVWEDLTLQQLFRIIETPKVDAIDVLSIVTGFSREYCTNIPANAIDNVLEHLYFLRESPPDFKSWKRPKEILVNDVWCKVPTDLKKQSWGQKIMAQQEINAMLESKQEVYTILPYVLSVYLYPLATGDKDYTDEKVRAFIPQIMQTTAMDSLPIGYFFLSNYLRSLRWKERLSIVSQLWKANKQESKDLTSSE